MPVCRLLVRISYIKNNLLAKLRANYLQAHRQTVHGRRVAVPAGLAKPQGMDKDGSPAKLELTESLSAMYA